MLAHDRAAQQASRRSVYHGDPLPVPDATLITRNIEGGGRGPVRGRSRLGLRLSHRNIYQVLGCGLSPRSLAHCTSMPGNELSGTANSSGSGGGASCTAIGCNVSSSNSIKTRPYETCVYVWINRTPLPLPSPHPGRASDRCLASAGALDGNALVD